MFLKEVGGVNRHPKKSAPPGESDRKEIITLKTKLGGKIFNILTIKRLINLLVYL